MSFIEQKYKDEVKTELMKEFEYKSIMQVPKINKVVINMGLGEASANSKIIDESIEELKLITGQQPIVTKAKNSIAGFKLREEQPIGLKVTLRGPQMYNFLDKLVGIALPRVRDFQGLSPKSFDGRGNYTLGITEQIIFSEIDYDKVSKIRGMDISIVTTANTNEEGRALLEKIGLPFVKRGE
ncbi:MAG: 50S ribosomal protein L5 [Spiroplasma sp.]|nr:50S ribosomal protein L5 [Mycoplasmatales bacterium]